MNNFIMGACAGVALGIGVTYIFATKYVLNRAKKYADRKIDEVTTEVLTYADVKIDEIKNEARINVSNKVDDLYFRFKGVK